MTLVPRWNLGHYRKKVLCRPHLIPQKLGVHLQKRKTPLMSETLQAYDGCYGKAPKINCIAYPFGTLVLSGLDLFDSALVGLVALVMRCVVL